MTVLVPSDAPTPFAALLGVLHALGLGLSDVRPVPGLGVEQVAHLFDAGLGDAAVLPAQETIDTTGEVAGLLSEVTGPLPWTVYSAPISVIAGEAAPAVAGFLGAVADAQTWLATHSAADIAGALRHRFGTDKLEAQVHALKSRDVWAVSPEIVVDDVLRWERALDDAGLIPPGAEGLVALSTRGRDLLRRRAGVNHES
jgi:ABC-type nitrate/sulfonate/bicarbonate transport system substrate-binding protein